MASLPDENNENVDAIDNEDWPVIPPECVLQELGITYQQYKDQPETTCIQFDVIVVLLDAVRRFLVKMGHNGTFAALLRAMEADEVQWLAWITGEIVRFIAASGLSINLGVMLACVTLVMTAIPQIASGVNQELVNAHALMSEADELVEPMPQRLVNFCLGREGAKSQRSFGNVLGGGRGGVNGG